MFVLRDGKTALGRSIGDLNALCEHTILVDSLGIKKHHCTFSVVKGGCYVERSSEDGILAVNGAEVSTGKRPLKSGDIIVVGSTSVFVFCDSKGRQEAAHELAARVQYGKAIARVLTLKSRRDSDEAQRRRNTKVFSVSQTVHSAVKKFKRGLPRASLAAAISGAVDDASDVNEMLREMAEAANVDNFLIRFSVEIRAPVIVDDASRKPLAQVLEKLDPRTVRLCMVATDVADSADNPAALFSCSMSISRTNSFLRCRSCTSVSYGEVLGPTKAFSRISRKMQSCWGQWSSEAKRAHFGDGDQLCGGNHPSSLIDPEEDREIESEEALIAKQRAQIRALEIEVARLESKLSATTETQQSEDGGAATGTMSAELDGGEERETDDLDVDAAVAAFVKKLDIASRRNLVRFEKDFCLLGKRL